MKSANVEKYKLAKHDKDEGWKETGEFSITVRIVCDSEYESNDFIRRIFKALGERSQ